MRKVFHFSLFVFLLPIFLLFQNNNSLAQDTGTLRGVVADSLTSEVLVYANAYIKELNKGANTDAHGYFVITSVPVNRTYTLVVSYIGYHTKFLPIKVAKNKITQYQIMLNASRIQFQTIEQTAKREGDKNSTGVSLQRISPREIELMPKSIEADVFRSIKNLSGIQSTGDVSARYYVRGGASNQNLVLVDGITIYSPFHALGLFGVIDPDIVNNIDFYKGGFNAKYGGSLSSVMSINTKDGNKNEISAKASGSFISGKLLVEGPLPFGSFIVSGRKSYSNEITKKFFTNGTIPIDFYDFYLKANYFDPEIIENGKFSLSYLSSSDDISKKDPKIEDYKWKNDLIGFHWFQAANIPLSFDLAIKASKFSGEAIPKYSNTRPMTNKVNDVIFSGDLNYIFDSGNEVDVGFDIKIFETLLLLQNDKSFMYNIGSKGSRMSFYTSFKFNLLSSTNIETGVRYNPTPLLNNSNRILLEPRINIKSDLFDNLSIKGSYGIIQQELTTLSDENEIINIFEPWLINPSYLTISKAEHYILGFDFKLFNNLEGNFEFFYKYSEHVPFINYNKIKSDENDFLEGVLKSSGFEVTMQYLLDRFQMKLAYTYSNSYKKINESWTYPKYDIRNIFNFDISVQLSETWGSSISWVYSSGLPFTQISGYYNKFNFSNIIEPWNNQVLFEPYTLLAQQNMGRLPDYHRLDFSISKSIRYSWLSMKIDFSIVNIYNRKNIFYFKKGTGERVNMLPFLPSIVIKLGL